MTGKKSYRITMMCHKKNHTVATVENVSTRSFKCPLCDSSILYFPNEHRIAGHGQASKGPDGDQSDHELRRVVELS